ncbi:NAD(P)-dependent oxidoreductase [Nocardia sp. 004]|uniref:NAD(P)-dependent oxidoreductase n=1 Tax=Nocardia sp. 004 TaxID=3385978 RepID=UPI0039A2C161
MFLSSTVAGLPLLSRYREELGAVRHRMPLILVTHVLPTAVPFIRALARDFDLKAVVAIPYSYVESARAEVADVPVVVPEDAAGVERALLDLVLLQDRMGLPFVVQEIGGYLAPALVAGHRFENLIGVVEDTRQGHWRYRDIAESLPVPVLSVAESPLKALEHHQIGRAIVYSLERQLRQHFYRSLSGESVAVIGFGDIGSAAARALRGRDAHVVVHDVDPLRQASAWLQGFRVAGMEEAVRTSNLILGCSGYRSLNADILSCAPDGAVFASGSSKQVEIDVSFFFGPDGELSSRDELSICHCEGRRYFLLNAGKPINFLDGSAIGSTLDLVYTELYACTVALATRRITTPGLLGLSGDERRALAVMWLDEYAHAHRPGLVESSDAGARNVISA